MSMAPRARAVVATLAMVLAGLAGTTAAAPAASAAATAISPRPAGWSLHVDCGNKGPVDGAVAVESTDTHSGDYALRFTRTEAWASNHYLCATQFPHVAPGAEYHFSFWVKSLGTPAVSGRPAPSITVTGFGDSGRARVPTGAYDWRHVTTTFTTGPSQTQLKIYIILETPSQGLIFDDLSLTAADGSEVIANGGFEHEVDSLSITNTSLLLDASDPTVDYTSSSTHVRWTATDTAGLAVASGDAATGADGNGRIDLSALGVGFYDLSFSTPATPTGIPSAPVAILADASPVHDPRLGVAAHPSAVTQSLAPEAAQMGFAMMRTDANWAKIEKSPGAYTWSDPLESTVDAFAGQGIQVLPITDYTNPLYDDNTPPSSATGLAAFGDFAAAVDQHFGTGMIEAYNEPRLHLGNSKCGATGACYQKIQQAVYQAVKAESPDTTVLGPALSGPDDPIDMVFLNDFIAAGGLNDTDALSIHPYENSGPPELLDSNIAKARTAMADAGGPVKPIWITELGWSVWPGSGGVDENVQADYLIRAESLAFADGLPMFTWYELNSAGHSPTDREANFGLIRSTTSTSTNSPRPVALAQAVFARHILDKPFSGRLSTPSGVYGIAFGAGADATNVLWSSGGATQTVAIPTNAPLAVTDREGRTHTLDPTGGNVVLQLTGSPVFVAGPIAAPQPAAALVSIDPTQSKFGVGVAPTVTLRAANTDAAGPLTFHLPSGDYQAPADGTATVTLPARTATGNYPVSAVVTAADGTVVGIAQTTLAITTPLSAGWQPTHDGGIQLTVTNDTTAPITASSATWTVGGTSGVAGPVEVPAGHTGVIPLSVTLAPYRPRPLAATIHLDGGGTLSVSATASFNPIWPVRERAKTAISIADQTTITDPAGYGGPADLSGSVTMSYDRVGIHLEAQVVDSDDEVHQTDPRGMWHDDSLQVDIARLTPGAAVLPGADTKRVSLQFGRVDGQPTAFLSQTDTDHGVQGVLLPHVPLVISRSGITTTYHVTIPWSVAFYPQGQRGEIFSMSWLVNDNDAGQRSTAEWGGGISTDKKDSNLNAVVVY